MTNDTPSKGVARAKFRTYSGQQAFAHAAHQARVQLNLPDRPITEREAMTINLRQMAHEQAEADIELVKQRFRKMGVNPAEIVNPQVIQ